MVRSSSCGEPVFEPTPDEDPPTRTKQVEAKKREPTPSSLVGSARDKHEGNGTRRR